QPLAQLRPDVPAALVAVVETMMAQDPEQRFATPREASAALGRWLNEASPTPLQVVRRTTVTTPVVRPAPPAPAPAPAGEQAGVPAWAAALLLFVVTAGVALAVLWLAGGW